MLAHCCRRPYLTTTASNRFLHTLSQRIMSDFVPLPPFAGNNNNNNNAGRGGGQQRWQGGGGGGRHHGGRGFRGGGRGFRGGGGGRGGFRGGGGGGRRNHGGGGRWNNNRGGGGGRGGRNNNGGGGRHMRNEIFDEIGTPSERSVGIAIEGCSHGALDTIYTRIQEYERTSGNKIEVLLCCGDFQSLRAPVDFHNFAAPPKYRQLGSFVKYYSGEVRAPILTIFVGGNHENSQSLQELYYGGWVAPNIYYLGAAGVVTYKGVRIGGISGIYNDRHYHMGHFERPPYDNSSLRSVYHVRTLEVYRFKVLAALAAKKKDSRQRVDVMVSHDWPQGIENHGNTRYLLSRKPYFRSEVERNCLGSPANHEILQAIKPKLWFSAHLHVGFRATVNHSSSSSNTNNDGGNHDTNVSSTATVTSLVPSQTVKADTLPTKESSTKETTEDSHSIQADSNDQNEKETTTKAKEGEMEETPLAVPEFCKPVAKPEDILPQQETTKFVSLDKCLPGRSYLSIAFVEPPPDYDLPTVTTADNSAQLQYDPEWLAILLKTHPLTEPGRGRQDLPTDLVDVSGEEVEWIRQKLEWRICPKESDAPLAIPDNFVATVPPASSGNPRHLPRPLRMMGNPQTDDLLKVLELEHILTVPYDRNCLKDYREQANLMGVAAVMPTSQDDNEIDIDDGDEGGEDGGQDSKDNNEIDIDDIEEGDAAEVEDSNEIDLEDADEADEEESPAAPSPKGSEPKKPRIS